LRRYGASKLVRASLAILAVNKILSLLQLIVGEDELRRAA